MLGFQPAHVMCALVPAWRFALRRAVLCFASGEIALRRGVMRFRVFQTHIFLRYCLLRFKNRRLFTN